MTDKIESVERLTLERQSVARPLPAGPEAPVVRSGSEATPASQRLAVGIATTGRAGVLRETLVALQTQIQRPDCVFICCVTEDDVDRAALESLCFQTVVIKSRRGLACQRNAVLSAVEDYDVIVFFDDDFLAAPDYLQRLQHDFQREPDVAAMTGRVVADGITGPGLTVLQGLSVLGVAYPPLPEPDVSDLHNAYGCNMAFRLAPIFAHRLLFDEQLPLYGWLEDVDFCRQLIRHGRIVKNNRLIGVHLGVKGGRTSGLRFGYSQIANPLYLTRKGTLRLDRALLQIARNVLANTVRVFAPEPWCDRAGRVRGNLRAMLDLVRLRLHPQRILEFER